MYVLILSYDMSLCHKLPISIRTFVYPPELSPMPQCVWEGEGDLTAARQWFASTGLTDREKLPRWVSVWPRHSRHWAWQFASMGFLGKLPAVVWWVVFGPVSEVAEVLKHQKWMVVCVFFVWWERARRNFRCRQNSSKW